MLRLPGASGADSLPTNLHVSLLGSDEYATERQLRDLHPQVDSSIGPKWHLSTTKVVKKTDTFNKI